MASRQDVSQLLLRPGDALSLDGYGGNDAAVLVALYRGGDGDLWAVLTRRRKDLRRHPGEISFPGGRPEAEDEDLRATALRETEEEIGLPSEAVEIIGALQPTPTMATGYSVYPFVGMIEPGQVWKLSEREVAQVIELPLRGLSAGYARRRLVRGGLAFRTDTYLIDTHLIWGATARILADLFDRVLPLSAPGRAARAPSRAASPATR